MGAVDASERVSDLLLRTGLFFLKNSVRVSQKNCRATEIDGVVLTGGIANSELLVEKLRRKVRFIAPVAVIPGEFEMEALAAGITRVLKGEEKARVYREHEEEGA